MVTIKYRKTKTKFITKKSSRKNKTKSIKHFTKKNVMHGGSGFGLKFWKSKYKKKDINSTNSENNNPLLGLSLENYHIFKNVTEENIKKFLSLPKNERIKFIDHINLSIYNEKHKNQSQSNKINYNDFFNNYFNSINLKKQFKKIQNAANETINLEKQTLAILTNLWEEQAKKNQFLKNNNARTNFVLRKQRLFETCLNANTNTNTNV
jgi:hypothetical protein